MYSKPRTQRSIPSRLNAVGPTKKIGCSLVRKNVRISEIPFSPRDPNTSGYQALTVAHICLAANCRMSADKR